MKKRIKNYSILITILFSVIVILFVVQSSDAATPDRFFLDFSDAYIVLEPSSGTIQVVANLTVLSYGGDWEFVQLKPYLYHLRLKTWSDFYWKVNTSRKEVYRVNGGAFGSLGGSDTKIDGISVDVVGGNTNVPPDRFLLRFSKSYIVYEPGTTVLQVTAEGYVLSYGGDWEVIKMQDYLYHMRLKTWMGFYWKVNTSRKEVKRVEGAALGSLGGTLTDTNIAVRVVGGDTTSGGTEIAPIVEPGVIFIPGLISIKPEEDCISCNPNNLQVVNIGGNWKIVEGSHWLMDFGDKEGDARESLKVIKFYGMDSHCFVGRPNASFEYWLVGGTAPVGGYATEDCVSFNPNTIEVKFVSGRWKIVDGSNWMFDFGGNEAEARLAYDIIKYYGFTKSCFVGRPGPKFMYLRK